MQLIIGGKCEKYRSNANTSYRSVLILDIDNDLDKGSDTYVSIKSLKKILFKYEYFMYTTFSHTKERERFRVVIPLSEDIESSVWQEYRKSLIEHFPYADSSCFNLSQGQGVPTYQVKNRDDVYVYHNQGKYFDLINEVELIKPKAIYENVQYKLHNYDDEYIAKVVQGIIEKNIGKMERTDAFIFTCFLYNNGIIDHDAVRAVSLANTKTTPEMHYKNAISGHIKYMGYGWTPERMKKYLPDGYLASIWKAPEAIQRVIEPYDFIPGYNRFTEAKKEAESNEWEYYELTEDMHFSDIASIIKWAIGVNVLISDCATGKTRYWVDVADSIMVVPYKTIAAQNVRKGQKENDIAGGIATYNQIKKILDDKPNYAKYKKMTLVIDEGHVMYADAAYRANEIRNVQEAMKLFKSVIIMSGTVRPEYFSDLEIKKVVRVTKHYPFEKLIRTYRVRDTVAYSIGKIKDTKNKALVLVNNKDDIERIIESIPDKRFVIITKDTKKSLDVIKVLSDKLCGDYDVIIGTQSVCEGVSFEDILEEVDVIVIDTPLSSFSTERIEQVSNRWRCAGKINVYHYINTPYYEDDELPRYLDSDVYIQHALENVRVANNKLSRYRSQREKNSFVNTYKETESKEYIQYDYDMGQYEVDYIMIDRAMAESRALNDKVNVLQYMSELQRYGFRFVCDEYMFKTDLDDVRSKSKELKKSEWKNVVNKVKEAFDFEQGKFTGNVSTDRELELLDEINNVMSYGLSPESVPELFYELEKSKNSKSIMKKIKSDSLNHKNSNGIINFIEAELPKFKKVYSNSRKEIEGLDSYAKIELAEGIINYMKHDRFDSEDQIVLTDYGHLVDKNGALLNNDKVAHDLLSKFVKLENNRIKINGKDIRITTIVAMNSTGFSFK